MSDCCSSMLKYVIFLCNFLFFVTGCVVIGLGVYLHLQMSDYYNFIDSKYLSSAIVLIVAGGVIVVIAFFGCCGACTENACMMYTFGTLLALVLVVEVGLAITIILFKDNAMGMISTQLANTLVNYRKDGGVTDAWDNVQKKFECCGVNEYKDWKNAIIPQNSVPDSCCMRLEEDCGKNAMIDPSGIHQDGCLNKLKDFLSDNAIMIGGIAIGLAVLQLIGVCLSCCLASRMRADKQYV